MKIRNILITAVMAAGVAGCAKLPISNPLASYTKSKLSPLPEIDAPADVKLAKTWGNKLAYTTGLVSLKPLTNGDIVYVADHKGLIKASSLKTGDTIWQHKTHHKFSAGPKIIDDRLVIGTSDAEVVVLNPKNGASIWQTQLSSAMVAPAAGNDNILVIKTLDGAVVGLDARDGAKLWRLDQSLPTITLRAHSAPVVVGEKAIIGTANGKCLAVNIYNGYTEWERHISIPKGRSELQRMVDISADPLVKGDMVYIVAYQGKVAAINHTNGVLVWEKDLSSYQDILAHNDKLYVTDSEDRVWALDAESGLVLWQQDKLKGRQLSGPVINSQKLVVVDRDGFVHWLDSNTGVLMAREGTMGKFKRATDSITIAPEIADNKLLLHSTNGTFAVYNIKAKG